MVTCTVGGGVQQVARVVQSKNVKNGIVHTVDRLFETPATLNAVGLKAVLGKIRPAKQHNELAYGVVTSTESELSLFSGMAWNGRLEKDVLCAEGPVTVFAVNNDGMNMIDEQRKSELLPAKAKIKWLWPVGNDNGPHTMRWNKGTTAAENAPEWVDLIRIGCIVLLRKADRVLNKTSQSSYRVYLTAVGDVRDDSYSDSYASDTDSECLVT